MLLKGQTAIITGGASPRGLGLAMARMFAEHGCRVAIFDLDGNAAREAAKTLKGRGHMGVACDVMKQGQITRAIERVINRFGRIDILVNNAGITSPQRLMDVDQKTYDRIMDINMRGTLMMTQGVVPHMRSQKSGSIVNMSSVSATNGGGVFGGSHYCAAKAAVLGYTKAAARELGPDQIRVNAICPSYIDTGIAVGMKPEQRERLIAGVPLGRAGEADDVAGCALFLASSLSKYVTGSEIDVNGGSHIH